MALNDQDYIMHTPLDGDSDRRYDDLVCDLGEFEWKFGESD